MEPRTQQLIDRYIRTDPHRPTPDEAIVLPAGVKVWAIIGQLRAVNGDACRVARGYDLPEDAVRAAMAYYHQHALLIDNRLEANVMRHALRSLRGHSAIWPHCCSTRTLVESTLRS